MAHKTGGEDWWEPYARDPRSVEELIQIALEDWDKEDDFDNWPSAMTILHAKGDHETFVAAQKLTSSRSPKERAVAACVLGEFGFPERAMPSECVATLLKMLEDEADLEVVKAVCSAFYHHERSPEVVQALIRFKQHPDEDVRFGVVKGLLFANSSQAIATLIELSRDIDEDVRDWATFSIGNSREEVNDEYRPLDTPEIRQALWDRLDDPHWETRFEALDGLAMRQDIRIVERIVEMLANDDPMFNTELCEALREMLDHYTGDPAQLALALENCREDRDKYED